MISGGAMMVVMIATAKAVQIIHGNCRKEKRNFDLLAAKHPRNHTWFGFDTANAGLPHLSGCERALKHAKHVSGRYPSNIAFSSVVQYIALRSETWIRHLCRASLSIGMLSWDSYFGRMAGVSGRNYPDRN